MFSYMTRYHPNELREGMVLARTIYGDDGRVLLRGGTTLRATYIARLQSMGIPAVYVLDPGENYVDGDVVSEAVRTHAVLQVKSAFQAVAVGRTIDMRAIDQAVDHVLQEVLATRSPILGLSEIRARDAYTYCHSVNVCIISLMLGIECRLNMRELHLLGVGALLHDIGKVHVPKEILSKAGPLTEDEMAVVRRHCRLGYDHLRVYQDVNLLSALVAYQHHERLDGSGYPQGLTDPRIHLFSRIVMVADVYDAMTSERVYRPAVAPADALGYLIANRGRLFAPDVVSALVQIVGPYPSGARVVLNTGEVGRVVAVNPMLPERPKVRIVHSPHPHVLSEPLEIDLRLDTSRWVEKVLHE